jgi:transposase
VLFADASGVCIFYKRLDAGTFSLPASPVPDITHVEIDESTLDALLDGIRIAPEEEPPRAPTRRRARRVH